VARKSMSEIMAERKLDEAAVLAKLKDGSLSLHVDDPNPVDDPKPEGTKDNIEIEKGEKDAASAEWWF